MRVVSEKCGWGDGWDDTCANTLKKAKTQKMSIDCTKARTSSTGRTHNGENLSSRNNNSVGEMGWWGFCYMSAWMPCKRFTYMAPWNAAVHIPQKLLFPLATARHKIDVFEVKHGRTHGNLILWLFPIEERCPLLFFRWSSHEHNRKQELYCSVEDHIFPVPGALIFSLVN